MWPGFGGPAPNLTNTKYFTPHQDYLQVYPGEPTNVLGTLRIRLD